MAAPPSSLRTNQHIIAYYETVADAFGKDVPIRLQDFPSSTGVQAGSATLGTLSEK